MEINKTNIIFLVKGATIATRAASKWEGVMIKLSGLSICLLYTQRSILTVLYVVCYQLVTRNSNNISGYVYNRELILPSLHLLATPPPNSNFESDGWIIFSNSCFWWCYQKHFSEYNLKNRLGEQID